MGIFNKNKKRLEAAYIEQQRLGNEIVEQRRRQERLDEEKARQLAAQRREFEAQREAQRRDLEIRHNQQIEEARRQLQATQLARMELEQREAERRIEEQNKARIERARLEREAKMRREKQKKIKTASPETLRTLRVLIRDKYQLDVEIWRLRNSRRPDRWIVELKMEKADAVVQEIMAMIGVWEDNKDGQWDEDEWECVQEIRQRLMHGGVRIWANDPLWTEATGDTRRVSRRDTMMKRFEAPDRQY